MRILNTMDDKIKLTLLEKSLFCVTAALALYNFYELNILLFGNEKSVNGFFDLSLPIIIIANLFWLIKKGNRIVFMSLILCFGSVVIALFMIKVSLQGFSGF